MLRFPLQLVLYTIKKSAPFFNLTLDCLLNLQEKYYQCINFGARCKLEPKRFTHLGICFLEGGTSKTSSCHRLSALPSTVQVCLAMVQCSGSFSCHRHSSCCFSSDIGAAGTSAMLRRDPYRPPRRCVSPTMVFRYKEIADLLRTRRKKLCSCLGM
jgi:hypothetical protein